MNDVAQFRLFLAVLLPDDVRAGLDAAVASLRTVTGDVRWVHAEALHLTLVFLGERPVVEVPAIAERAAAACSGYPPFTLTVEETGCFPGAGRPRVLWAGLAGDMEPLLALQRAVLAELVSAGLAQAGERFSPHLTLGRVRDTADQASRAAIGRAWSALRLPPLPSIPVRSVHLMRSELGRVGARYTSLAEMPLGNTEGPASDTTSTSPS